MTATDLERELARLADSFDPPVVPVSADVARGRRRLLRTRVTVAGAAAATAAVLASATLLGQGTPQSGPQPIDRTPDAEQTEAVEPREPTQPLPDLDPRNDNAATLSRWNDLLAGHLDPEREHLQPYTRGTANSQSGQGYLGTRFTWTNPGEEGMGMLVVGVARSRAASWDSPCVTGQVTCRDARGPDGEEARIGTSDSTTVVELEQADGDVVTLTLDLLFGNNSTVPISGADITPDQLLEAAADERLDLPVPPPTPDIDSTAFGRGARELASQGRWKVEGFAIRGGGLRFQGFARDGARQVAIVEADAYPTSAGYGLPSACPRKQYRTCGRREVDGQLVFVARDRQPYFPGTEVVFAGSENVVRVQWQRSGDEGADPDLEALIAFVTDPRWQT